MATKFFEDEVIEVEDEVLLIEPFEPTEDDYFGGDFENDFYESVEFEIESDLWEGLDF